MKYCGSTKEKEHSGRVKRFCPKIHYHHGWVCDCDKPCNSEYRPFLSSSIINCSDINAVTALTKIFVSFEKNGWSMRDNRIKRSNPEVNQKSEIKKTKL